VFLGSHALRLPLDVAATFDEAVRCWWPDLSLRLWTESRESGLEAELRRLPGNPLRAVAYADEVVLTADRSILDAESLRLIGAVLMGDRRASDLTAAVLGPRPIERSDLPCVVRVPLRGNTTDVHDTLVAAVGRVLSCYRKSTLVGSVRPDRSRPANVLGAFDVIIGEDAMAGALDSEGLLPWRGAPFPLTFVPCGAELELRHGLDDDSARRFAVHVSRVYEQLCAGREISLLDAEERVHIVALGSFPAPGELPRIDSLFLAKAQEQPDAIALSCSGEELSYGRLADYATRFASVLLAEGVQPGDRVGICLDRSVNLVVAMLAVLLADAVYVPMDPAYPSARLADTANDAGVRVLITEKDSMPGVSARLVRPSWPVGGAAPLPRAGSDSAAYVIYTSGSTGKPKGVVVPHRNVTALLEATREDFALIPDDVWALFHSSAFDFSVWEIWGALLTGARLVVVPYWTSRSPEDFHTLLVDEGVTVLNQTPSAFTQLMSADRAAARRLSARLVVFGGEPLDKSVLTTWFDRYPERECRLVNMFGITETTVHVTARTVTRADALARSRSVGHPLPGWHIYVLDERGGLAPLGVAGEIYVGGAGVAIGYLGRPDLTAERFVPDPFNGGRMYRSGDRGKLLPDGTLDHLGRLDSQVKLRGFRIEPGEIRAALLDDPAVTAAAVVLSGFDGDAAEARIDAYVTLDGETAAAVRRRIARVLPAHMMPSTVTALEFLPLTANGKCDLSRLPSPVSVPPPVQPAGAGLAATLTTVWQDVLGVIVTPADNFFELGGNSLYAVRIAAVMRERGLPRLPLRQLYLTPTVSELAQALASAE
jgi:amino acid adenylation domain-containing protein